MLRLVFVHGFVQLNGKLSHQKPVSGLKSVEIRNGSDNLIKKFATREQPAIYIARFSAILNKSILNIPRLAFPQQQLRVATTCTKIAQLTGKCVKVKHKSVSGKFNHEFIAAKHDHCSRHHSSLFNHTQKPVHC